MGRINLDVSQKSDCQFNLIIHSLSVCLSVCLYGSGPVLAVKLRAKDKILKKNNKKKIDCPVFQWQFWQ